MSGQNGIGWTSAQVGSLTLALRSGVVSQVGGGLGELGVFKFFGALADKAGAGQNVCCFLAIPPVLVLLQADLLSDTSPDIS